MLSDSPLKSVVLGIVAFEIYQRGWRGIPEFHDVRDLKSTIAGVDGDVAWAASGRS
jgi:hypothetical protein